MSVRRPLPGSISCGITLDERFLNGERVYKFDNLTDHFEGRFVFISLSTNGLVFYWKQQEIGGGQKVSEAIYVDEIVDVYVGCCTETSKQKVDSQIKRIFSGTFSTATCTISSCFLTVMYGTDAVNPTSLTFLTNSEESAKLWALELRRISVKLSKELPILGGFYYWQRLFTKISHSSGEDFITVNDIVDALIPSKNKEDRREVERLLKLIPTFKDKKSIPSDAITDDFIFTCYRTITDRTDVQSVFNERFQNERRVTSDLFAKYLKKEHYDPRLNELLYPSPNEDSAQMLIDEFDKTDCCLNVDAFHRFLMSSYNIPMLRDHLTLKEEDMHKPLSHYFINCSHNTYLRGYQVNAKSSVEIYRYVLLSGCRSVELDCWDGSNGEPIITHGPSQLTRVTPVLFKVSTFPHFFTAMHYQWFATGRYQVNAKSSVEIYRYVLLSGCRSVELDCWDGSNGEPIITHGPSQLTRVTPVLFKDVIIAIAETAFITSVFPVILSFENHCSMKQQKKMAAYCREVFGDMLLVEPLADYPIKAGVSLPSPNALRRKILVKSKKLEPRKGPDSVISRMSTLDSIIKQESMESSSSDKGYQDGENEPTSLASSETEDAADDRDPDEADFINEVALITQNSLDEKFVNNNISSAESDVIASELSDLVNYMRAMGKLTSFEESENKQMSSELFSMTETRAYELVKQSPIEFVNHNKRQITRIYPKGKRVDSSNFWPIKFWNCGCQMAAMNMQTPDTPFQMNSAFFEQNGRCGYVLKPNLMRKPDAKFNPFETRNMDLVVPAYLSLTVISAQMLSVVCDKRPSTYVEVNFYGHFRDLSMFSKRKYRTRTVPDNGINPIYATNFYHEEFKYEKIIFPAMASIRLAVFEDGGRLLGQRFLQVHSIQPGYRHVLLRNASNRPIGPVTLFVLFRVHDYVDEKSKNLVEALQNPIAAMKKEQAASAAFVNPIEMMKIRESMLHALEESEPRGLPMESSTHIDNDDSEMSISFDKDELMHLSFSLDFARDAFPACSSVIKEEIHQLGYEKRQSQSPNERLKSRFYLEDMELLFSSLEDLAINPKVVKLEKAFRKKYSNVLETIENLMSSKVPSTEQKLSENMFAALVKYEKERSELLISLGEHNRKKLLKRIDMAHKCESKQLTKLNHQRRFDELSRTTDRSAEGAEEMREKYVKLGVEEQRRLNKVKEKRVKEIDEKFDLLKIEVNVRMDDRIGKASMMLL
ncbi:1-phosphatidylinositol 4,5-bisphosphate phosphodiesterase beta-4 [Toxocara canis]|uniref:1-phosphatidylinositol 4,5-bisphosphate phosphodiesterase n=1 Tax=Toxocara canis TaxID=6265 RepID=A0A0B2UZT5_TOXCA|nr:1-phosphatidylinositol 4,5-bisphosphate phosphodiesterase beta-4 [Toxocara canis]